MARLSVVVRSPGVGVGAAGGAELGAGGDAGSADGATVSACVGARVREIGYISLESPRARAPVKDTVGGGSAGPGSGVRGGVEIFSSLGDQEFQNSACEKSYIT